MKNEKGFTLIEVLVALGLLGVFAAVFLTGIATSSKAILIADERTTAESLARSQMEAIKEHEYIDYSVGPPDPLHGVYGEITPPPNYGIDFTVEPFNPATGDPYGFTEVEGILVFDYDDGLQKITVTVSRYYGEKVIITLEDYKVNR